MHAGFAGVGIIGGHSANHSGKMAAELIVRRDGREMAGVAVARPSPGLAKFGRSARNKEHQAYCIR